MSRILLNIDIGERGPDHAVDRALMRYADIINIACGGHAGDTDSVSTFRALAEKKGIMVTAHLSYPDKANFGRTTLNMPFGQLRDSLNVQLALMRGTRAVKFHGALYNDSCADEVLAGELTEWLAEAGISLVVTSKGSELDRQCQRAGIRVLTEAFAERRYSYSQSKQSLSLVSRKQPNACITDYKDALENVRTIIKCGQVQAFIKDENQQPIVGMIDVSVDTICIHSDSLIALELAKGVAELLGRKTDPCDRE